MVEREINVVKETSVAIMSNSEPVVIFDSSISSEELERRRKISESWQDPEFRARMSAARRTRWRDPEFRARMHESRLGKPSPMKGRHHTPEARAKMSQARRGRLRPELRGRILSEEQKTIMREASKLWWSKPENRRMMSERRKGRKISEEQKQLLSRIFKGREVKQETRRKISKARQGKPSPMRGKHHSEESRERMSEGAKRVWDRPGYRERMAEISRQNMTPEKQEKLKEGNKRKVFTPELRDTYRRTATGRKHSKETLERMSKAQKGHKTSEETKRKISDVRTRNWQDPEYRKKMSRSFEKSPKRKKSQMQNIQKAIAVWRAIGKLSPEARKKLSEKAIQRWKDPVYRRRVSEAISASRADKSIETSLWNLVSRGGLMRKIVKEGYLTREELGILKIFFEVNKGQGKPPFALIEKMSIGVANLAD